MRPLLHASLTLAWRRGSSSGSRARRAPAAARAARPPDRPDPDGDRRGAPVTVGSLTLRPCGVVGRRCAATSTGLWEPGRPGAGTVRVGFAFVPARDRSRPAVGHARAARGRPGLQHDRLRRRRTPRCTARCSTRRNLLLVDQRGTGRSDPIDCPDLQNLHGATRRRPRTLRSQPRARGRRLHERRGSADDLAAVIRALGLGPIDLYGDSYGTFFAQVFAGSPPRPAAQRGARQRLPDVRRERVVPDAGAGDAHAPSIGLPPLAGLPATAGRRPTPLLRGCSGRCAHHAVARRGPRRRRPAGCGSSVNGTDPGRRSRSARRTGRPSTASSTAALRSALRGDRRRCSGSSPRPPAAARDAGPVARLQRGARRRGRLPRLPAAVRHDRPARARACASTAPPVDRAARRHPASTRRSRVQEYLDSDWEEQDWCTRWPVGRRGQPRRTRRRPPGGHYPRRARPRAQSVSSTRSPRRPRARWSRGSSRTRDQVRGREQLPRHRRRRHRPTAPSGSCARFVRTPSPLAPPRRCATAVAAGPRARASSRATLPNVAPARGLGDPGSRPDASRRGRRPPPSSPTCSTAGGTTTPATGSACAAARWSYTGDRVTIFHLHGVRLTRTWR